MRKLSASNDSPPELTYSIDRDLGRYQFADALEAAGLKVVRYDAHFKDDARDEEWLPRVGREGWIGLTHDRRISRDSLLIDASMRTGVRLFILRGKAPTSVLASNFLVVEPRVRLMVARNAGPFIAKVFIARNSTRRAVREAVQMYLAEAEWRAASE